MPLPYHQSERLFRRYEHCIAQAVEAFPNVVVFQPSDKEHQTFVARMRNLKSSLATNRFSTIVDLEKLDKIGVDNLLISDDAKRVLCGSKEAIKSFKQKVLVPAPIIVNVQDDGTTIEVPNNFIQIETLCFLAAKRALTIPLRVLISEETATKMNNNYDINLTKNTDGSYTLI